MLKTLHLSKEGSRYTALESAAFMTAANLPCALLHGVYLHQDAINPRKKKKIILQDPLQLHAHSPGWGGSLLRGAVR